MTPKKSSQVQMQAPSLGGRFVQDNALKPQGTLTWVSQLDTRMAWDEDGRILSNAVKWIWGVKVGEWNQQKNKI